MKNILLLSILLAFFACHSQNKALNTNKNGVAIEGYDPVSYFSKTGPTKGKIDYYAVYEGATYYFSSQVNYQRFSQNPVAFVPQYGGWCAYAMALDGSSVSIDPETYTILEGKLYLFYNKWGNNTLEDWNKDEHALQEKADLQWNKK